MSDELLAIGTRRLPRWLLPMLFAALLLGTLLIARAGSSVIAGRGSTVGVDHVVTRPVGTTVSGWFLN
jgi:hypothetical protein